MGAASVETSPASQLSAEGPVWMVFNWGENSYRKNNGFEPMQGT